jgi:hypothetical protein
MLPPGGLTESQATQLDTTKSAPRCVRRHDASSQHRWVAATRIGMGSAQFNFRRSRFPLHGFELPQCRIRLSSGNLEALVWCADKERRTWGVARVAPPQRRHPLPSPAPSKSALCCARRTSRRRPQANAQPEQRSIISVSESAASRRLRSRAAPVAALGCIVVRGSLVVGQWIVLDATHSLVHWCCICWSRPCV